ncbi:MAG: hypothetical protein IPL99_15050 [Candidatus Competibacteraceae bacterium]|nr:hypothetical protein [Candidatus Competibacteraceae bacterium]
MRNNFGYLAPTVALALIISTSAIGNNLQSSGNVKIYRINLADARDENYWVIPIVYKAKSFVSKNLTIEQLKNFSDEFLKPVYKEGIYQYHDMYGEGKLLGMFEPHFTNGKLSISIIYGPLKISKIDDFYNMLHKALIYNFNYKPAEKPFFYGGDNILIFLEKLSGGNAIHINLVQQMEK